MKDYKTLDAVAIDLKRSLWALYKDVDQETADYIQIHVIPRLTKEIDKILIDRAKKLIEK